MAYGSGAGGPDVTRASKDEGRQPRFVAESVKNAVELCVDIFVLAVKVREVGKHANLSVDVEGGQHIPAVRTCPIYGDTWQHWKIADQTKSVEELYTVQERVERLRRAICRLQPTLRNVVEIHQSEDRSVKEVAELAGISVDATKSRLLRARRILRKALS